MAEGGGGAAGAAARHALKLSVSHGVSSFLFEIEDKQLATEVIRGAAALGCGALICMKIDSIPFAEVARGIGIGAGVAGVGALAYFWMKKGESAKRAVTQALEPDDGVRVEEIRPGCLLVKLRCHTPRSFLQFISDYESQKVKRRLEQELSKVGFTEKLTITIENKEEVEEQKKKLRYVSWICEQVRPD